jgi:hypothetical protein
LAAVDVAHATARIRVHLRHTAAVISTSTEDVQ